MSDFMLRSLGAVVGGSDNDDERYHQALGSRVHHHQKQHWERFLDDGLSFLLI